MNGSSVVLATSWASTVHTPGPVGRGRAWDHGALLGHTRALRPHHGQPDVDDIGVRWAVAWYHNIRSRTSKSGDGHVAA